MIRVAVCVFTLLLASLQPSRSEPQRYEGALNEHPIIAFVDFRNDDSVAGLFYNKGDPGREFVFKGSNSTQGLIQIRIAQGGSPVGVAELRKSVADDNIVWQGAIHFADDTSFPLTFARTRAQEVSSSPSSEIETSAKTPAGDSIDTFNKTFWKHNGSTLVMTREGKECTFRYQTVRTDMRRHVSPGATLFEGIVEDGKYRGTARRFKQGLDPIEYPAEGVGDDQVITLHANAPRRDGSGRIMEYVDEVLRFEYVGPAD
jgi:hypothetical protein